MDSSLISIEDEPRVVEPISLNESGNIVKLNDKLNLELDANNTVDGFDGENDRQEKISDKTAVPVEPVTDSNGSDHFSDDIDKKETEMNNDKCEIDVNIPSSNHQMLIASEGFKAGVSLNHTINQGPGKIYFVKFVPKPANQVSSPTESTFAVVNLPNADKKDADIQPELDTKIKVTNPIVATTSSGCESLGEPSKPIGHGHTVNLLNNNRILIKSVKNKNCDEMNSETPTQIKNDHYNDYDDDEDDDDDDDDEWIDDIPMETKYTDKAKASLGAPPHTNNVKSFESNNGSAHKIERDIQKSKAEHIVNSTTTVDKTNVVYSITTAPKIKREFEQLSKTVNESKILSEFIINNSKRNRRSGKIAKLMQKANNNQMQSDMNEPTKSRSYSPSSVSRSASKDSDRSANSSLNSSNAGKRNTRSRNTDFSAKQKRFLKGIQQYTRGTDDESENNSFVDDDEDDADFCNPDTKHGPNAALERRKSLSVSKLAKTNSEPKNKWDKYCWRCHQQQTTMFCSTCIRSYHPACIKMKQLAPHEMEAWICSECIELKASEQENKKKKFDVRHFNKLLKYAMNRILQDGNLQQFQFPVNKNQYPDYNNIIIYPINLSKIEDNIDNLRYTNSEAFMSEIKWILHNCSIYFSDNYKVMRAAKSLQKVSKQEIYDIETCAECYLNANTMTDNWFTETCAKPHLVLWAKLKGFPFWPAKAMSINAQMVDVRFFGEHDRAHVPSKDCYLYSLEDPNPPTNKYKRNTIADCVKEVDVYIENIKSRFGSFRYAEIKTPFNPQTVDKHLADMIPTLNGARGRRKSIAKYDLTLKIVKTADNHLSVVKKDQPTKESPQIKRTIDITGDGAVSRTPTPPAQISSRRKTTTNRGKTTNRFSDGNTKFETTLDKKSYQVLRRKSMAVEKAEPKNVAAVIFKRKSIHSNSFANELEDSMSEINSNAEENSQTSAKANHLGKKRKPSNEQMEPPKQVPEKRTKVDASKVEKKDVPSMIRPISDEEVVREENILSSVGLMKRISPLDTFIDQMQSRDPRKLAMAKRADDKRNANVHNSSKDESPTKDKTPIALVPFVEIKEETNKSPERNVTSTPNATYDALSNSKETISLSSEDNSASIKTEFDSDEDSLMIIDDDFADKTKETSTPNRSTINSIINDERLAENIARGTISVRDISKLTDKEHKTAKKSFPRSSATATTSMLKPRTAPASARTTSMNNMVCIPLDGLPRLDLISNSAPPPLAVVSSANNVSLLSRNQPTISTSTVTTNEPPPLSISSVQVTTSNSTSNQSGPSSSMPTITNGMITEQMASAITDALVREPPKLTSRPKAPLCSDGDIVYPTGAGSVSQTLMENAHKMTDFFRSVMEDTMKDLANTNLEPKVRTLELELEQLKNTHSKEMADLKANTDRLLAEMKKSMEKERSRIIEETRKQCELERIRSVKEAKRKQWCAFCSSEAQFYCCWNTSYCSYTCQRKHWQIHMNHCSQVKQSNTQQPTQSNTRKSSASSAKVTVLKPDPIIIQPQLQSNQQTKSSLHGQKDRFNVNSGRSDSRLANNNSMVPGLRSILPKNAVTSTNVPQRQQQQHQQQQQQMLQQQQQQHKATPLSQASAIIINRSLMNSWGNSNQKSGSLLNPNTILLSSSPSSYAKISAPVSTPGVSLLSANHTQNSTVSETIIIP